jgi:tetratricopeptide (TPR) repeat protein
VFGVNGGGREQFTAHDALLFGDLLGDAVRDRLQMPASVSFWYHEPAYWQFHGFTPEQVAVLSRKRDDQTPFVRDDLLVVPLAAGSARARADVVVHGLDPALLDRMDPQWMLGLQQELAHRFAGIRRRFVDPLTGLYNQDALERVLAGTTPWQSLFLIATVPRLRSIAAGFQKIGQLASLLEVSTRDPLFYFGQGVFGHVSLQCDRKAALEFSHRLIGRLKRERLRRIHIGFGCLEEDQSAEEIFEECWQALLRAEQRGPYSLCDARSLRERSCHPLALPSEAVLARLGRKWRGLSRFGLVLLEAPDDGEMDLVQAAARFPDNAVVIPASDSRCFVLLPEYSPVRTADTVNTIFKNRPEGQPVPSVGYCHWPSSAASRKDCVRNCAKAIVHGTFYGPGAVVGFDALSLNVSGDLYFDEGDYKQAIREYRTGLILQPDDVNLLNSLGVALAEVNRHREAVDCFSRVLAARPGNHMALVNKGMSCRLLGREDEAVQCFEWALQSRDRPERESLDLYFQLARLYCGQEKFDRAAGLLESWQEAHGVPEEFLFFRLLGEAYLGTGRNRDAITALQRSLQLHPRNSDSLSMLGYLYVLEGEGLEVGLSLCERAIAMDEGDVDYRYRKAAALYHAGLYEEALKAVREALQRRRGHAPSILLRGDIYRQLGWKRRAMQSYRQFLGSPHAKDNRVREVRRRLDRLARSTAEKEVQQ